MVGLDAYLQFILDYAPYFYYIPGAGVDPEWGRGVAPAAFAIDFLYDAYQDSRFESQKMDIYNKIVALADWILTQQCTEATSEAYGGFKSNESSLYFYSVDACRVIPALLKAYALTNTVAYLNAAKLAGATFLYNMQHRPFDLGLVDKYYGGFARAVSVIEKNGSWQIQASYDDICLWNDNFDPTRGGTMMGFLPPEYGGPIVFKENFRFISVGIKKGSEIKESKMKFFCIVPQVFPFQVKIDAEKVGNAPQITSSADYNSRVRTTANELWIGEGGGTVNQWFYCSVNFKAVLQEVIDLEDWQSGNAVNFFFDNGPEGTGLTPEPDSFDGDPAHAPILEVTWEEVDWLLQMDVECLYGLIGLKMLAETHDTENASTYETMMTKAVTFLRSGFEDLYLHYDPPPSGDGSWHRVGLTENEIYDDPFAYALLGLYDWKGWSLSCEKVYELINTIAASADYPGYNAKICWAGYIDVVKRKAACDYYDAVTSGILHDIRAAKDKPSLKLSVQIINLHYEEFMFWGVKFYDWSPVENKQSIITVSWLGLLLLRYKPVTTLFTSFLNAYGKNITLYSIVKAGETVSYSEGITIKAVVRLPLADEVVIEPGFIVTDFVKVYTLIPIRLHDKIMCNGVDYEVGSPQVFRFRGEPQYYAALCRRLVGQ